MWPRHALRQPQQRPKFAADGRTNSPEGRFRSVPFFVGSPGRAKGLKKYGMLVADNGQDWAISVAPDERIPVLHEELRRVPGSAFEVVQEK